jgi:hypothetical protein
MAFAVTKERRFTGMKSGRETLFCSLWGWAIRPVHGIVLGQFYRRNTGRLLWTIVAQDGAIARRVLTQLR